MTTANKITILRILAVPFFIVQLLYYVDNGNEIHRWLAVVSFALAAICDGVDGYIARRFNQKSELGAVLDPLADKLLLVSAIILLSRRNDPYLDRVPLWLTGLIIGRDVILVLGWGVIYFTVERVVVHPNLIGKAATVFQMIAVVAILLKLDSRYLPSLFIAAGICTGGSGALYVLDGVRQLSASPRSSPSPGQGE
jgi:CDP-diacylglycerol--glycerol-3-phosphate 3-phosphatidyltransferase